MVRLRAGAPSLEKNRAGFDYFKLVDCDYIPSIQHFRRYRLGFFQLRFSLDLWKISYGGPIK
jgi:hypothetical protein